MSLNPYDMPEQPPPSMDTRRRTSLGEDDDDNDEADDGDDDDDDDDELSDADADGAALGATTDDFAALPARMAANRW